MKKLFISALILLTLFCNAQYYNVGLGCHQFTNSNLTEQNSAIPTPSYQPINQTIDVALFIERIRSNELYYRLEIGTSQSNSTTVYQNIAISYFVNTYINTKIYSPELRNQTYHANIGIGRIFPYKKLSLRAGAALGLYRYQRETNNGIAVIDNSTYSTINSYTSYSPYNEYLLNYYISLHYTLWKNLSLGIQLDNGIGCTVKKQTISIKSEGYGISGALINSTTVINTINNNLINTYFLTPSISIIYGFHKRDAPINPSKTN